MITSEQLRETTKAFRFSIFSDPYSKMRHALEVYEEYKWTKFDANDSSTWPEDNKTSVFIESYVVLDQNSDKVKYSQGSHRWKRKHTYADTTPLGDVVATFERWLYVDDVTYRQPLSTFED
jgi:hypothetical protein